MIGKRFVGVESGLAVGQLFEVLAQSLGANVGNVLHAHLTAALHQRMNGVLARLRLTLVDVLLLAANESLIALDNLALAADGASLGIGHRLAQTHAHEPS